MDMRKINNDYIEVEKNTRFGFDRIKLNYHEVQEILNFMVKEGVA